MNCFEVLCRKVVVIPMTLIPIFVMLEKVTTSHFITLT